MPLFMDVHRDVDASAEDGGAHKRDVEIQAKHGVKYLSYWVGEDEGAVFCLFEGPSKEAGEQGHREAHGLIADEIFDVEQGESSELLRDPSEAMTSTTQRNVETVQQVYDGFNDGDIESVLATMADDVEWTEPDGSIYAGTYDSPTAVLENVFKPAMDDFETFEVQADRFIDGGDTVVVVGTFRVTTETGERINSPFAHVVDLHDGHITQFENYTDTALWR